LAHPQTAPQAFTGDENALFDYVVFWTWIMKVQ
jgi:hypothetical protein